MTRKLKVRLASGLAAVALQFLLAGTASAHYPQISAVAICNNQNEVVIEYTSTAWPSARAIKRLNPEVHILVNNVKVDEGAYASPNYQFSGSTAAPPGSSAVVTALAVGEWGDGFDGGQSASTTVTYPEDCEQPTLGRFTGGGRQLRLSDGLKITRGLTIHCDLLLSNNLEVNWEVGNKFHMNDHLVTTECSDNPGIVQQPPPAPLDTLVGRGTGRYNNQPGYTIEFTLVDAGEPGGNDQMAIKIYETADPTNVVLDVPLQQLTNGNLQAHYDQPHKN